MKFDVKENHSHGILKAAFSMMGWAYREQPVQDVGIDAQVEIADREGNALGKLLAVQVKAGTSFFAEEDGDAWVFRTDAHHRDYWVGHSLPVVVALVDLEREVAYFERLDGSTLLSTGKGYKALVPKANVLEPEAAVRLAEFVGARADVGPVPQGEDWGVRLERARCDSVRLEAFANESRTEGVLRGSTAEQRRAFISLRNVGGRLARDVALTLLSRGDRTYDPRASLHRMDIVHVRGQDGVERHGLQFSMVPGAVLYPDTVVHCVEVVQPLRGEFGEDDVVWVANADGFKAWGVLSMRPKDVRPLVG